MNTVYTVAFSGTDLMMVYNDRRKGWEMPGGTIEDGETPEEAAVREYMEEAGYAINVISVKRAEGCWVCAASLGERMGDGEMMSRLFKDLPDDLAFERSEYDGVLEWARSVTGRNK